MKYLFIVQGEGRGHLTQALSLKEMLQRSGHEVTEVMVGISNNRHLPQFFREQIGTDITTFESVNFLPTAQNRRSKLLRSAVYNFARTGAYLRTIRYIHDKINASNADVVVNFYEFLTGLTYAICRPDKPYFCIGHQYVFLHRDFCAPDINRRSLFLLRLFTRLTSLNCQRRLALSFRDMNPDDKHNISVVPPLLRRDILNLEPEQGNYILGYMVNAGFAAEMRRFHEANTTVPLHVFWDKGDEPTTKQVDDTLTFHQVDDKLFLSYMRSCSAYASTAGFESICEAMYLGKPILMVPAHAEQDCNAADAVMAGAGIAADTFDFGKLAEAAQSFKPNAEFPQWARRAEARIVPLVRPQSMQPSGWAAHVLRAIVARLLATPV